MQFRKDIKICRGFGITGFPTFQIKNRKGEGIFIHGSHLFESFEHVFEKLGGNSLKKKKYSIKEEDVLDFIKKFKKVATQEVATLFGIKRNEAYEFLCKMKSITSIKAGNDYFWIINHNG